MNGLAIFRLRCAHRAATGHRHNSPHFDANSSFSGEHHMTSSLPSATQIGELSTSVSGCVPAEFIDSNGHMNVQFHLGLGARGADALVRAAGIDEYYRQHRRLGVFAAEHHLRYYSELRMGDRFSVYARALDRSAKTLHLMSFLVNMDNKRLSGSLEIALVHVDLETRGPTAFPADIAAALDHSIAHSRSLNWPAPTCGFMGVRR